MKVEIQVSIGELFDKITILDIKKEKIQDEPKLVNIYKEFELLEKIALSIDIDYNKSELYEVLYDINCSLWVIEDSKREHEKNKDFGEQFIFLAREVYKRNDRRFNIKRLINEKYGSEIIEEKSYK
jgi:hypothetical protein